MSIENIDYNGKRYAEIIWSDTVIKKTNFFSLPESSFQFGLLANKSGYVEDPHYHKPIERKINDLHQMFVVQRGVVAVDFYDDDGSHFKSVTLKVGDGILLMHGTHAIRVLEDMQCISVKQGPFYGDENDKIIVKVKND